VAPLIPGVNDAPEQIEPILDLAGEAGARSIAGVPLHLRGEVKQIWFDWLRQYRPDLIPRYEALYERGAYMRADERKRLSKLVRSKRSPGMEAATGRAVSRGSSDPDGEASGPAEPRSSQKRLF
jgi:DNA repair photolyase